MERRPVLNKTFLNFFFGFLALIGLAFVVLLVAGSQEPPPPDINVAHQ